jgi:glycosyltransferase involved in cell wall biosynthesis
MDRTNHNPGPLPDNQGTTIIIPAYNEEEGIAEVLKNLQSLSKEQEIIVVDDGSGDRTAEIAKSYPYVKLISYNHNAGYGAALKTGIRAASGNTIIILDADGTYPHNQIPELLTAIQDGEYAMVVGARTSKNVNIPLVRRPAKWFINRLADYLSGMRIPDLNSGLRGMKKPVIEKFMNILPDGFSFTTTVTLALLTNGYQVKYIPIDYHKREGKSKIRPVRDSLNFIQLIIRTILYFNPLRVFIPLSICLTLFAFFVLFGSWFFLGKVMDVTFGVILMTAVMVLAIGMLADLIDKRTL